MLIRVKSPLKQMVLCFLVGWSHKAEEEANEAERRWRRGRVFRSRRLQQRYKSNWCLLRHSGKFLQLNIHTWRKSKILEEEVVAVVLPLGLSLFLQMPLIKFPEIPLVKSKPIKFFYLRVLFDPLRDELGI